MNKNNDSGMRDRGNELSILIFLGRAWKTTDSQRAKSNLKIKLVY